MKRVFFHAPLPSPGMVAELQDEERHHLCSVRRVRVGERVEVLDGEGGLVLGEIAEIGKRRAQIKVIERLTVNRESPLKLILGLAMPVQVSTFFSLIPFCCQLGVSRIDLIRTAYSGDPTAQTKRTECKFQTLARQSIKQCGRLFLPKLASHGALSDHLDALVQEADQVLCFHPGTATQFHAVQECGCLALLIGPEGGFSQEEIEDVQRRGVACLDLGPRMLRTETAVIGACFWAQSRWGDLHL